MRSPPRRGKREEQKSATPPPPPATGAETRNDAMSAQSAWSPGGSLRTRSLWRDAGSTMLLFIIPSMIFRQIKQTQGWRSAWRNSGISARGFAPAPESGENAKTGRMSPNDSPAPGPSGSISLREAAAQKGLSRIMRSDIPALSGLIRPFLCPEEPHAKGPEGTAPRSLWVCAAVLNSQST